MGLEKVVIWYPPESKEGTVTSHQMSSGGFGDPRRNGVAWWVPSSRKEVSS